LPRSKAQPPEQIPDGANDLACLFYISDPASGSVPRVQFTFKPNSGPLPVVIFDHALSDYTTITPAQKVTLRNLLAALRDETFTLEGYT
jgi:hypothetical protein